MSKTPSDSLDTTIEPDRRLEEATALIRVILQQKGTLIDTKKWHAGKSIRHYSLEGKLREHGNIVGIAYRLFPQLYMLAEAPVEVRLMNGNDSTIYVLDGMGNVVNIVMESQLKSPWYIGQQGNRDRAE